MKFQNASKEIYFGMYRSVKSILGITISDNEDDSDSIVCMERNVTSKIIDLESESENEPMNEEETRELKQSAATIVISTLAVLLILIVILVKEI